jgi:predicted phage tail protein
VALFGVSMLLIGAANLLAGDAKIGRYEAREAPEDRPNFVFSQIANTLNEGGAVQWVFGKRVRVGSTVLSAGIFDEQIGPGLPQPEVDGLRATFSGSASGTVGA